MVPQNVQGLAYILLFAQQQALNPDLTPDQFKVWLKETVIKIAQKARK